MAIRGSIGGDFLAYFAVLGQRGRPRPLPAPTGVHSSCPARARPASVRLQYSTVATLADRIHPLARPLKDAARTQGGGDHVATDGDDVGAFRGGDGATGLHGQSRRRREV